MHKLVLLHEFKFISTMFFWFCLILLLSKGNFHISLKRHIFFFNLVSIIFCDLGILINLSGMLSLFY